MSDYVDELLTSICNMNIDEHEMSTLDVQKELKIWTVADLNFLLVNLKKIKLSALRARKQLDAN